VGTGRGTSVTELITVLAGLAGLPGRFEVDPDRMRADDGHVSDPARLMSEVGWRPHVELRDGLAWLVEDVR
jgi:nucleoside-diphosphate-sugar epimerase